MNPKPFKITTKKCASRNGVQSSCCGAAIRRTEVLKWVIRVALGAPARCPLLPVRPEGANHQWRKIPPGELSIDLVADERLGWVTGRAGAS